MNGSTFDIKVEPNEIGRTQFYEYQTNGKYKHEPWMSDKLDKYFFVLKYGKHQFDIVVRECQQTFKNKIHWGGLYSMWSDWEGDRWLLRHVLKWKKDLPEWIDCEDDNIEINLYNKE